MFLVIKIPLTKCNAPYDFMLDPYRFSGEVNAHNWGQVSKSSLNVESFWKYGYKISLQALLFKELFENLSSHVDI